MENWESKLLSVGVSSAPERIKMIADLISDWHGPAVGVEAVPGVAPEILRRFYAAVGGSLKALCKQNRIVAPSELQMVDGKVEFAVENQNVFSWSVESGNADPPVYSRLEGAEPWALDVPTLSLFLTQFTLFELLMAAPYGASAAWLTKPKIEAALSGMRELPLPNWHRPAYPGRFFVRRNALAFCCPNRSPDEVNDDTRYSFWLGARELSDVEFIRPELDASWEYASVE